MEGMNESKHRDDGPHWDAKHGMWDYELRDLREGTVSGDVARFLRDSEEEQKYQDTDEYYWEWNSLSRYIGPTKVHRSPASAAFREGASPGGNTAPAGKCRLSWCARAIRVVVKRQPQRAGDFCGMMEHS